MVPIALVCCKRSRRRWRVRQEVAINSEASRGGGDRSDAPRRRVIGKRRRRREPGGLPGGSRLHRGAYKLLGEDVPTGLEIAVRIGDDVPGFVAGGVWRQLDYDHVDGFAGRESGAGHIDIGIWLV